MATAIRVLLIGDAGQASSLAARLSHAGYDPGLKAVGSEGELVSSLDLPPDLIVAWHPPADTIAALGLLHELDFDIPFIVISEVEDTAGAVRAIRAGAYDYLAADSIDRLADAVREALEVKRERDRENATVAGLRQSEQRHRLMIDNSRDLITMVDLRGRFAFVSDASTEILGYEPEDLVGTVSRDLAHPGDHEVAGEALSRVLSGVGFTIPELRVRHKDGRWISVEVTESPVRDASGEVTMIIANSRDITEKKRIETELRDTEAKYRALVENIPALTYIEVPDTDEALGFREVYVSPQVEWMFGYTPEEWIEGQDAWRARVHQEDRNLVDTESERTARSGEPYSCEYRMLHRDGHAVWVHDEAYLVRDETGVPEYWHGVMTDITDRKRAEEALSEAEQRYRMLVEHIPAVTYIDVVEEDSVMGYRTSFISPQAESLFGYPVEAWGDPTRWLKWVHPEDRERVEQQASLGPDKPYSIEYRLVTAAGDTVWVRDEAYPVLGEIGQAKYWHGVMTDITERKRAEEETVARMAAEQANRAKDEFLSRMSHEFRTPLNAVLGFAQLLDMDDITPTQRDNVEQISRGGQHLLDLINEVLDISRIEAGRIPMWMEPTPVDNVLSECVDLLRPLAEARGIAITTGQPTGRSSFVLADTQRLKQVVLNLLSNGVKYNRDGGEIRITCSEVGESRARIEVTDTGPGIPADQIDRAFAPFERLGAERLGIEGTGLGLTLSKNLVEAMGGTLTAESTVGVGSTFAVELLLPGPSLALPELPPEEHPEANDVSELPRTLLYIEDNLSNLLLVERILERVPGTRLLSAMQGGLGLKLAREHVPDLILLDLHLPDIEGEEVLERLRQDPRTRDIRTVILTADANPDQAERLLANGADAYLTKPLDVEELLRLLG